MVTLLGIVALLVFAIIRKDNSKVKAISIDFTNTIDGDRLVSDDEIIRMMSKAHGKLVTSTDIKSLDLQYIEGEINKDKRIKRADVYVDSKGSLHVRIEQMKPIMRISKNELSDVYIDENGKQLPTSIGNSVRVPIVSGFKDSLNFSTLLSGKPGRFEQIFKIMSYVYKDSFLSGLIEQAYIDESGDWVLIPKVGKERIIFGDSEDIVAKFDNLKIFYRDGMSKLGWGRYSVLNLKYSKQVRGILSKPELAEQSFQRDSLISTL